MAFAMFIALDPLNLITPIAETPGGWHVQQWYRPSHKVLCSFTNLLIKHLEMLRHKKTVTIFATVSNHFDNVTIVLRS
jgi:hypothetical protein